MTFFVVAVSVVFNEKKKNHLQLTPDL